ncbi:carnitine O-palmitoyltransferase 1, liver isoform-like [Styela clava]
MSSTLMPTMYMKDDGELLYTTLVGMVMAAIFATGFHDNVDQTLTNLAPQGTTYPFPSHTRLPAAKLASAIAGFLLGVFFWTLMGLIRWSLVRKLLTYRDWLNYPKAMKTKFWMLSLKILVPRKKVMYAFQHVLPKYPLPRLSDTCRRLLEVFQPLVTEQEFKQMTDEMREFEKGEGPMLHAMLEKKYQTEENWVAELWDNFAYLSQRTPIVVNTSIGCLTALNKTTLKACPAVKQVGRAASLAYSYLTFYEMRKNNTLPSILVLDLVPICAHRYKFLMACTRIPGVQMDELKCYDDSKHIIVFRKGIMYRLEVYGLTPSGEEKLIPAEEIQRQLEIIMDDTADIKETAQNPSLFTGQPRAVWARDRERLQLKRVNAVSLRDVESAIFHVVLEDTRPGNLTEEAWFNLCSQGYNLWCDKSMTIQVHENSRAGLHFEHSTADATLYGRLLEFAWNYAKYDSQGNAVSGGSEAVVRRVHVSPPQRLEWDLSQFTQVIPKYEADLNKLCNDVEVKVFTLFHGKGAMKKCRVSPDGFMQMALQLAFYRMHKSTPKTYESASTRFFKYGRTETIRTVSMASVAFTKAMDNPNVLQSEKAALLKKAINHQHNYKLQAMNGQACDRHMFGLYIAAKMAGVQPRIFQNKALLSPDQLSTSQSPYSFDSDILKTMPVFPSGGVFGPQRPDGYGVYYLFLADDAMTVYVSSIKSYPETDSTRMGEEILKAIDDIKELLGQKRQK